MSENGLNKIDFEVLVSVKYANPNGDPLSGNRPRTDYDDIGEISDVCIKRKIRNRMMDLGYPVFVQPSDRTTDGFLSLKDRMDSMCGKKDDDATIVKKMCNHWLDVRTFGQVIALGSENGKGKGKGKGKNNGDQKEEESTTGKSIPVRGPVSIQFGISVSPVEVKSFQITKSVNNEANDGKRGSDTMGRKNLVKFGLYVIRGAINPSLAARTGFSWDDAQVLKECLRTLFVNDSSSARPEGSMEVRRLYWWEHDCPSGQYSSAKVQRTVHIALKDGVDTPTDFDDYEIKLENLDGLVPEVMDGE